MKKITLLFVMALGFLTMNAQTYFEDFNNGIPSTYQLIDVDGLTPYYSGTWDAAWVNLSRAPGDSMASSTSYYSPAGTANDWMILPKITPATGDFLVWEASALNSSYPDGYLVKLSTTDSAMASFTTTLLTVSAEQATWTGHSIDMSTYVGQGIFIAFINNSNDMLAIAVDNIAVMSTQFDVKPGTFSMFNTIGLNNAPVAIKASMVNLGLTATNTYEVAYSVNGGTPVTGVVTAATAVGTYGSEVFTHPTSWSPTTVGTYTVKLWINDINGTNTNVNNDTITTTVEVLSQSVQRIPLYETFTSSTCAPCVAGNTNMQALFAANANKWNCVKYQMSWPGDGDPYYTAEGGVRRTFYNVTGVPHQLIDGGYDGNSSSVMQADFDAAYGAPAFMSLSADMILGGTMVTVDYTINPEINFPSNSVLHIAIVEKKTTANVGSNGETEFHWVMKKMLPNAAGTSIGALTAGTPISNSLVYAFNGSYRLPANANSPINHATEHSVEDFTDLIAVIWIQNPTTKEIYQSALSTYTVGMNAAERNNLIKSIYPNPATDIVNVDLTLENSENVEISVINNLGQVVSVKNYGSLSGNQSIKLNVSGLESGIYHIQVKMDTKIYTKPLQVK